ncbi:hypothetical protein Lal_00046811 [Lupinus albus]|nr:hypothetical protein Lal_00046811 [Lupinus albus]
MPLTRPPVRETRRYQTNHSRQCQRQASKWKDMVPPDPLRCHGYGNPKESVDRITRHAEKLPWEKAAPSHNPMGLPPLRAADIAQKA